MGLQRYLAAARRRLRPGPAAPTEAPSWVDTAPSPWDEPTRTEARATAWCNICRWTGETFLEPKHAEFTFCPRCGSVGRDRFLFWSFISRTPPSLRVRVLETSPRLGDEYRRAMARWFTYTCSDYDERAHAGTIRIDLQAIDLPDGALDVIITPHVLEHVPDTDRALDEIHRVLAPGGRMYLQVPLLQGTTAPPTQPEFHGDDTPVFWRFGPDLTSRLREHGFDTRVLCTADWKRRVEAGETRWSGFVWGGRPLDDYVSGEFDVDSLLAGSRADDLDAIVDDDEAAHQGFVPSYMYLTWEAIRD